MSIPIISGLFSANKLSNLVKPELEKVDQLVRDQVYAFDPELAPYMEYICATNGKRLRPVLSILTGGACGGVSEAHLRLGVLLELVHMSSLVHDDIIDEASVRRGVPTPNEKWGNGMAVLLGDALFAHAMMLSTEFGSLGICRELGQATRDVCEGEILQSQRRYDYRLSQPEYFRIIEKKTAALFAAATSVGAQLAGMDDSVCRAMRRYGVLVGTAYQVYDDCIDIVGTEEQTGKTLHTDSEKGKLTLPMLFMLEGGCNGFYKRMTSAIDERRPFELPVRDTAMAIARSVVVENELTRQAREQLNVLPDSLYKEALNELTLYLDRLMAKCM